MSEACWEVSLRDAVVEVDLATGEEVELTSVSLMR